MSDLRILVVDDEEGMRLGVTRALAGHRLRIRDVDDEPVCAVEQAASGEEALDRIAAAPPDLVLLDHKLPGISGLEVLETLAGSHPDTLIIMITAYATLETAVAATKRGAYDFLAKPFTPQELKASVQKAAHHLVLRRRARRLEEEKRQVRFQFLSVLAHELKAPLGAVEGYLSLLRDGTGCEDPAQARMMVERSLLRVEGMRKLIYDLLDLTRIESGQKQRELDDQDLSDAAATAVETLQPEADRRGVRVEVVRRGDLGLRSDRGELEIILNNLVSNAIKYNREGGRVTVDLDGTDPGVLAVAVTDTGIGMKPADVDKLFGEFVRIKNEHTRSILGSGLGLSIVRRLARLNGGDVRVASEPGAGSTFTVTLSRRGVRDAAPAAG